MDPTPAHPCANQSSNSGIFTQHQLIWCCKMVSWDHQIGGCRPVIKHPPCQVKLGRVAGAHKPFPGHVIGRAPPVRAQGDCDKNLRRQRTLRVAAGRRLHGLLRRHVSQQMVFLRQQGQVGLRSAQHPDRSVLPIHGQQFALRQVRQINAHRVTLRICFATRPGPNAGRTRRGRDTQACKYQCATLARLFLNGAGCHPEISCALAHDALSSRLQYP